ncbi:centrosome-associated protein 350 isoform X2 [Dunckerocampus dactyliophorus]|uniref:centrosome-associated protein 350 isoform X2 n=1 Tax=Dunckerocampus dactyliophorus TaxID=161453 RepID=UPI00240687D8|nr:centrosome-associated protein 350 isoform X2 [Dunckerocampus dactyliophorus]
MGEMRSSKRAPLSFGITVHQHSDNNLDTDLATAWKGLPQSKAALRRIENHVEAVPGTTALLLSVMDPPKKKQSVTVRSRDETTTFSKSTVHRRSSSKKRRSRSPLRNATQDSNVDKHNSMALREALALYSETAPPSQPSSQLQAYRLQSVSGTSSSSSQAPSHPLLSKPVYQRDNRDKQTDGHQDAAHSRDCTEVRYLNDPPTVDTLQTYANPSTSLAMEDVMPETQITQRTDIQECSPSLPPASDSICRPESNPSTSPGSDSQRLENLRRHQHDDKLEKLKERIRKQVKHQEEAAEREKVLGRLDQPILHTWNKNGVTEPTAKIRKVAAAPQAPSYKGFSKTESRNLHGNALKEEYFRGLNSDICLDLSRQLAESTTSRPQQGRHRSFEREAPKPTRKIHKVAPGQNAKSVITPASWREGLKLVNKVLGTAPKRPREDKFHLDDRPHQTASQRCSESEQGSKANHHPRPRSKERTGNACQGQSKSHSTSAASPASAGQDKCPAAAGKDLLSADIKAILNDPQVECKDAEEKERSLQRSGGGKGGQRGKARSLSQTRTPLSFWGTTVPTVIPSRGCRSANPSPNRPESSNVAETKEKKRHYDADKIRQYIVKQKEERKRRQVEEKKSLIAETEKRNQRLQELYRRQKEMAKTVVTPTEATVVPLPKQDRDDMYNLLTLEEVTRMQPSAPSNQLRPIYQPSGESDKENKKMELPQSPSSSDRSLNDQLSPPLERSDLDVGVNSRLKPDLLSPNFQSLSGSSSDALQCRNYDPLLSRPLRLENTAAAGDIKPIQGLHTAPPTTSFQLRRSRIDALKATAISLSNRIESEARQIARVGINYGEATSLDVDILAPSSTPANLNERGLVTGHGTLQNGNLTSRIQRLLVSTGLSSYDGASLPGAGHLHTFSGQPQQISADLTENSPSSYRLQRMHKTNSLERPDDLPQSKGLGEAGENRVDLHDSSGGSISECTILSESICKDEVSPPQPSNTHLARSADCFNDFSSQRREMQSLTDFQEAAKCSALALPFAQQDSSQIPWEELNKVNERKSSPARSFHSGDSQRDAVYDDDFVSFHSSGVSQQLKDSTSHSFGLESKKSPPSRARQASPSTFPSPAVVSLKNEPPRNGVENRGTGKLQYSPSALQQYMAAELKYQESIEESLRQLGEVERLMGVPVAQQAKQQKSPPSRARMTSSSGFPDSFRAVDYRSEHPRNGFMVGASNNMNTGTAVHCGKDENRATGNLQYSPAVLHQQMAAELQYQESIEESLRHLGDVERLMGVSMAQEESASLAHILKTKQQKYENDLYEQKIQAEKKALEAQLQREEDRQRTARAHEELLEKLVLTQKETAEAARHIKELTDLARSQIEGALTVSVVATEPPMQSKQQREKKQNRPDSGSFQREASSRSPSHTDSRPVQRPNLIGADSSSTSTPSHTSTDHIKPVNKEETELEWKNNEKQAEREAGCSSIEEEGPTADNDSICSESIPSVADDKEYSLKFDTSRTEDVAEEHSFNSLLPSKVHRLSSLEKRPGYHEESDDEAATHNTTSVSDSHNITKSQNAKLAFSGGQDSFSRFTMDMVRQYMKDEDLRLQHQNALLHLRQKAVKEKIRTELAWLEHQKKQLRNKGEDDKLPPIRKKQKSLLLRLQEEQAEIKRLQEANKAARKEKQLLLKQQEEIEQMRSSTLRLKERLKSAGCEVPPETPVSEALLSEAPSPNIRHADDSRTPSPSPSISGSETSSIMQKLKKMRSHMDEKHCSPVHCFFSVFTAQHWASLSVCLPNLHPKFQLFIYNQLVRFLTKREQQLMQRRHHAEELLQWKQRLDQEEAEVRRIEKEALAGWGEGLESHSKEISEIIHEPCHHQISEQQAISDKEYVTEDDYSSAASECSIHTEEPSQRPRNLSSALPASVAETLASNQSSLTNYSEDFASLALSKQSSPVKDSITSKMQLRSSLQISKQAPNQPRDTPTASHTEPISEQSDIENRIKALKEELRKRKFMAYQLKREQKMRHKERLKAQEASLLKQLESYDNYIGKTKAELNKKPEPTPNSKSQKEDSTLGAAQCKLISPIQRSETNKIPAGGTQINSSLHQNLNRSTSASEDLSDEAASPTSVHGGPDFLTSELKRWQLPDTSLTASAEHAQIIESEKDNAVSESRSPVADLKISDLNGNPPSCGHSCRPDLDVISSVKEAHIKDIEPSYPLTDYQDDFESSGLSSPRKEQHISKPDSVPQTEIRSVSQDEEIEEDIAEELSHYSVTSGASHESGGLLDLHWKTEGDFKNDSHSIDSSHLPSPLPLLVDEMPNFNIGDRVLVSNVQPGTLRFKGPTRFAGGFWAGVELDNAEGSNCGIYDGVVYFECHEHHGIFAPPAKITHLPDKFDIYTDATGHEDSYTENVSDQCEDEHKSEVDISENLSALEKSEELSHNNVFGNQEFVDLAEQNLKSQEPPKNETHLDSKGDHSIPPDGQDVTALVDKDDVINQAILLEGQEITANVEKDDIVNQSLPPIDQDIAAVVDKNDVIDQSLSPNDQQFAAIVNKEDVHNKHQLISSEVSDKVEDEKVEPKHLVSRDKLADKLLSNFIKDTVHHLVQIKRVKEQKIEASNQINACLFELDEQGLISTLGHQDGLSSFLPEEEPSSPELFNRPESPILGASGQEELAKRLAELELNRDLLDDLGDDQDWFDEDFGLSSRREQQRLQQKQREEAAKLGAGLRSSDSSDEDPLRGLVLSSDGDQPAKTPPRPALPLPLPPKLPEQPAMVVPHSAGEVEKMVHAAIQEMWDSFGLTKEGSPLLSDMNCPKPSQEYLGVEDSTVDQEALCIRSYKKAVYDLTWEILQEIYAENPNANQPEWIKPQRVRPAFSHRVKTPEDMTKVQEFVTKEVLKLYGLAKNTSKKSDWQKMLKFGRKKRDRVDQILVQELHEEEAQWVCYEEDELSVKMQLADSIFDVLLKDTASMLSLITKRAAVH